MIAESITHQSTVRSIGLSTLVFATQGCAFMLGASVGPTVLATPRANTQFGSTLNAHLSVGDNTNSARTQAFVVGTELNVRATDDYGHGGFGFTGAYMWMLSSVALYTRLGFAPMSGSSRNSVLYYSLNTGLELGLMIPWNSTHRGVENTLSEGTGLLVTLRSDLDYRPGQGAADVFFSLNVGAVIFGASGGARAPMMGMRDSRHSGSREATRRL